MAAPLTAEDKARYTEIIDGILATADLETVTRKKIRMGLEAALGGKDLSEQKNAIKALIENRFDAISAEAQAPSVPQPESTPPLLSPKREANGHDENNPDAEDSANGDEIKVSVQPPRKKQRKEKSADTEDADAKLAALLQAQENQRTRATRGGGKPKAPAKKKKKATPRKKSDKKGGEDNSDAESEESSKPRKAGGGFQKPFNLSYALAEVCGEPQLSRPQVVKKLWEYIKSNELQDPSDKRQIRCDEMMQAVFKQSKVDMFQMNKLVGNHLYPIDEE
ncbi:hypothetical protein M426DRAFT_239160 [Hypoxylon sp. CI-4A]|nr:hypothetical protein M426DRAFT_239160 [Hypoxylon sp. CI-4A]